MLFKMSPSVNTMHEDSVLWRHLHHIISGLFVLCIPLEILFGKLWLHSHWSHLFKHTLSILNTKLASINEKLNSTPKYHISYWLQSHRTATHLRRRSSARFPASLVEVCQRLLRKRHLCLRCQTATADQMRQHWARQASSQTGYKATSWFKVEVSSPRDS